MPTPKLDFPLKKSGEDLGADPDKAVDAQEFIVIKLKQLCQAVDAINERLDKLENPTCEHIWTPGKRLDDGKFTAICGKCGYSS